MFSSLKSVVYQTNALNGRNADTEVAILFVFNSIIYVFTLLKAPYTFFLNFPNLSAPTHLLVASVTELPSETHGIYNLILTQTVKRYLSKFTFEGLQENYYDLNILLF